MSPVIRIPDNVYKRLESKAKGFDTPASVIEKLLDYHDKHESPYHNIKNSKDSCFNLETKPSLNPTRAKAVNIVTDFTENNFEFLTPKRQGELRRNEFIKAASIEGVTLTRLRGVVYMNKNSQLIGIASASESMEKPGTWFLGLPKDNYHTIVLLCGNKKSSESFSVIPNNYFLIQNIDKLSMDAHGQIKFHIIRNHNRIYIRVPGCDDFDAEPFIDNYKNILENNETIIDTVSCVDIFNWDTPETISSNTNYEWIVQLNFDDVKKSIRLKHIYSVLFFMKQGHSFQDATYATLNIFTNVQDYQTISDKCARGFAGSVDRFVDLFNSGETLNELIKKFNLSIHDQKIFKDLLD